MVKLPRRQFLEKLASAGLILACGPIISCSSRSGYQKWVEANDQSVENFLLRQQHNTQHPFHGGIPNTDGIYIPMNSAMFVQYAASSYFSPYSRYHKDGDLLVAMEDALSALIEMQHDDGSIDLPTTNFHSTPDTAFVVEPLALAHRLLDRMDTEVCKPLMEKLDTFHVAAGRALVQGGIHTPNHRWVVCMALSHLHHLYGKQEYLDRIDEWLAEGIDIDKDGQFDERSTAVYSPLTDRCLITLAQLLGKTDLLGPVRRNLDSTLYLLHPDGTLVTEGSRRQDQFREEFAEDYYLPFVYMALQDGNPIYGSAARRIAETAGVTRLKRYLAYFQLDEHLQEDLPGYGKLPNDYIRHFAEAAMLRIRRGNTDATFMAENAVIFTMQKGSAKLGAVRLSSAFFGKGQFEGKNLITENNLYSQHQSLEGPYYQPIGESKHALLQKKPWGTSRKERPQSEVQRQESSVSLTELEDSFRLDISIQGSRDVPVTLELAFNNMGILRGATQSDDGDGFFLTEGKYATYSSGRDKIRFGPGIHQHQWKHLRGALPPLDAQTVYLTGFTPISFSVEFS